MSKLQQLDYEDYARKMRLALCDKQITTQEGGINHKYFLVKKGQYWSEDMQNALLEHIEKDGCGQWESYLKGDLKHCVIFAINKKQSEIELELRTCLTFGISDITKYIGKKYDRE